MSKQLTKDVAHANPGGPDNLPPNTSRHPITLENTPEKTIKIMQAFPERADKLRELIRGLSETDAG